MAEVIKLKAEKRSEDKNPRQLRAEGILPATAVQMPPILRGSKA